MCGICIKKCFGSNTSRASRADPMKCYTRLMTSLYTNCTVSALLKHLNMFGLDNKIKRRTVGALAPDGCRKSETVWCSNIKILKFNDAENRKT